MRTVNEIADELYRLPPDRFTAARGEYVAQARQIGDRETATVLASFRRPSIPAWLVNLLALNRPQELAGLIELGTAIRAAQANAPRQQLRDLSGRRRRQLQALLAAAKELAARAGQPRLARHHLAGVEATLAAAMIDQEQAPAIRSGRLVKAIAYSGFGVPQAGGEPEPVPTPPPERPTAPVAAGKRRTRAPAAGEQRRAQARARLAQARRTEAEAERAEQDAKDEADRIAGQIAELRHRLTVAQQSARAARQARLVAAREVAAAQRGLAAAERP